MTPDWSVKNARWPLWPTTVGTAVAVYVTFSPPAPATPTAAKVYPLFTPTVDRTSSIRQAPVDTAVVQGAAPPRLVSAVAKPTFGYVVEYVTSAVLMVRREPTAEASFAAIRDRRRFGMAMAAMIRMIATTISNSIREKPFSFFMMLNLLGKLNGVTAYLQNMQVR